MIPPLLRRLAWLLPALAVAALYWQVRDHAFIEFDDMDYTYDNPVVARGLTWDGFVWAFRGAHFANYHPLTWLSHMLDVACFGLHPGAMALVNAGIHAANAVLVAVLFARIFRSRKTGVLIGVIFAVHPQLVEAVAWVSQRKTVLCTFFGLWTMLLHLQSRDASSVRQRRWLQAGALACFALSLLAKGMFVTMPVLLFLLEQVVDDQRAGGAPGPEPRDWRRHLCGSARRLAPYGILSVVMSIATVWAQAEGRAVASLAAMTIPDRLANALTGLSAYVWRFAYPANLSVFYPRNAALGPVDLILPVGALSLITAVLVWLRPRIGTTPLLGWCFFGIALLPVIGLVQVGDQAAADRYMYPPMLGLLLACTAIYARVRSPDDLAGNGAAQAAPRLGRIVTIGLMGWLGFAAIAGYQQVRLWRHTYALAQASIEAVGAHPRLLSIESSFLLRAHEYEEVKVVARQALRGDPNDLVVIQNLAVAEQVTGNTEEAIRLLLRCISIKPDRAGVYVNLAVFLREAGRMEEAKEAVAAARNVGPLTRSQQAVLERAGLLHD